LRQLRPTYLAVAAIRVRQPEDPDHFDTFMNRISLAFEQGFTIQAAVWRPAKTSAPES
jgi:hypothetical protein